MEVVGSRKSWGIREKRPRKRKLSFHTYARRGCEREKKIEGEMEREKERRKKEKEETGRRAERQRRWRCEVDSRWGVERKRGEKTRGWESFEYFANLVSRVEIAHARISSRETRSPFLTFRPSLFFLALPFPFFTSHPPLVLPALSTSLRRGTKSFANRLRCGISSNLGCQIQL